MLNQQDMTETAKAVLGALSEKPATAGEIAQNTHLTRERCQLILTQLVMAGLSDYQFGCLVITSGFQPENAGSIPARCSNPSTWGPDVSHQRTFR